MAFLEMGFTQHDFGWTLTLNEKTLPFHNSCTLIALAAALDFYAGPATFMEDWLSLEAWRLRYQTGARWHEIYWRHLIFNVMPEDLVRGLGTGGDLGNTTLEELLDFSTE